MYNTVVFVISLLLGSQMIAALPINNTKGEAMHNYQHNYKTINTQEVIELKKNIPNVIVVDSRTKQYDDGKRIQDAI